MELISLKLKSSFVTLAFKVALFVLVIFADIYVASIDNIANNAPIWGVLGTLSGVLVTKLLNSTDKTIPEPPSVTSDKEESNKPQQ